MGNATHVSYIIKLGFWYHRSTHGSVKVALSALFVVCKVKLIYKVEVGNANWVAYWLRVLIVVDAVLKSLHRLVRPHGIGVSPVLSSEDLIIRYELRGWRRKCNSSFLSGIWRHRSISHLSFVSAGHVDLRSALFKALQGWVNYEAICLRRALLRFLFLWRSRIGKQEHAQCSRPAIT